MSMKLNFTDAYINMAVYIAIAFGIALLLDRFIVKIGNYFKGVFNKKLWQRNLVEASVPPCRVLVWGSAFSLLLEYSITHFQVKLWPWLDKVYAISGIALLLWFLLGFVQRMEQSLLRSKAENANKVVHLTKIIHIFIFTTFGLLAIENLGLSISSILAFGGVGALAVGFAAKDILANILAALAIFTDNPFRVGDWISSPDKNIEGAVEYIGWRNTKIRRFNGALLIIPNSVFSSILIDNTSAIQLRRFNETFNIVLDDLNKVNALRTKLLSTLENLPYIASDAAYSVHLTSFNTFAADLQVQCYAATKNWAEYCVMRHNLLLSIKKVMDESEVRIAVTKL